MNNSTSYRMKVLPVSGTIYRPLWSVMIPTYNCANYLRETLASVLAQDPGVDYMQIEVIDDYSTLDDPESVVRELGKGRVGFYRQPQNVGLIKNFQSCLERSHGKLIHLLHGDDCVRDGFYSKLQKAFEDNPEIGAAFCRNIIMDEHGHWLWISDLKQPESGIIDNWLEKIATRQHIGTPSIVIRREVYENLGGFDTRLSSAEDWEMYVRIAAHYPVWHEVEPLAVYRSHSNSNTERHIRTAKEIQNLRKAVEIIQPYLPQSIAKKSANQALENWALYALDLASKAVKTNDLEATKLLIKEGLKCSRSFKIIKKFFNVITKLITYKSKSFFNDRQHTIS